MYTSLHWKIDPLTDLAFNHEGISDRLTSGNVDWEIVNPSNNMRGYSYVGTL